MIKQENQTGNDSSILDDDIFNIFVSLSEDHALRPSNKNLFELISN